MRDVALDTETTGLSHKDGHRITEIGCVELVHRIPTGRTFHCLLILSETCHQAHPLFQVSLTIF